MHTKQDCSYGKKQKQHSLENRGQRKRNEKSMQDKRHTFGCVQVAHWRAQFPPFLAQFAA